MRLRASHSAAAARHKPAVHHRHHLLGSIGSRLDSATDRVGHAAQHAASFLHHHAAASIGVAAIVAIVVAATITRGIIRAQMMRLARWMGVPRTGPPPPGTLD
jgi:hypothetical protein